MKPNRPRLPFFLLLIFLLLLTSQNSTAQNSTAPSHGGRVSGKVVDGKTQLPLEYSIVSLLNIKDSTHVKGISSNREGLFVIENIAAGNYYLKISFLGYKTIWRSLGIFADKALDAGVFKMEEGVTLREIAIQGEITAVAVKHDTTSFNTAAFKTPPDAMVEDGLKKLPGIEVDKDGNITANGKSVNKVTVDGKEFFGNDPKLAIKNIPYNAVEKINLVEDKTEQAKITGVDDGKREKVLDLKLKKDMKKGWFGSTSLAGGTRSRYMGSASINRFTETRQLNALLLTNNINQRGFSTEDAGSFGGYTTSLGDSYGLTTTHSGGLNYSDSYGKNKKTLLNSSYFAAQSTNLLQDENNIQQTQRNALFYNVNNSLNNRTDQLHRISLRLTAVLDSLTNITIQSGTPITINKSKKIENFAQSDSARALINNGFNNYSNQTSKLQTSGSVGLSRRLKHRNGTISWYGYWLYSPSVSDNNTQSESIFHQSTKPNILINREEAINENGYFVNTNLTLNRAITKDKKTFLTITPGFNTGAGNTDRNTLEYNPHNGLYELQLDSLSNYLTTSTTNTSLALGFNRTIKNIYIYLNSSFTDIVHKGNIRNNKYDEVVSKHFFGITPNLAFTYDLSPSKKLSFRFNTSNDVPTINDLFVKQNNNNPINVRLGNPDLKLGTSLNSTLSYSTSNTSRKTYSNWALSYSKALNSVTRQSYFDEETGITYVKPVNTDGIYFITANGGMSIPTNVKGLMINPIMRANRSRNTQFLNGEMNRSDRVGGGGTLKLSYDYKLKFNATISNRMNYSHVTNSSQIRGNSNIISVFNTANISYEPIKKWRIVADVNRSSYSSQSVTLFNAGLQYYAMEKGSLILEVKAFDLLNRNQNIVRYITETQIVDSRSNNLRHYFFMRLTYRVNKVGADKTN